jgi:hypothetical protein
LPLSPPAAPGFSNSRSTTRRGDSSRCGMAGVNWL